MEKVYFIFITVFFLLFLALLSMLNIIFTLVPKESSEYKYTIYFKRNDSILGKYYLNNFTYKPFLTDIKFRNDSYYSNIYGTTGEPGEKCYLGSCYNQREYASENCSEVCAISGSICEVDNKTCSRAYCDKTRYKETYGVCHDYNQIDYWRGQRMKLITTDFFFLPLTDIVLYNETCREGFKQCGYTNKEKDKLCIDATEDCPINKVIIKNDNITPTDFNYTMRPIGDKYLFYTTENTNNSLYINIIADSGINSTNYTEVIDNQSLTDFLKENPYIYDGNYTSKSTEELSKYGDAKLKMVEHFNQTSLVELRKLQAKYTESFALYSEEKLKEMNENVVRYKNLLVGFSIAKFVYILLAAIALFSIIANNSIFASPLKSLLIIHLAIFPGIFLNIYSFILVTLNKATYDQYYSMDYINDFMNWEVFWTEHSDCDEDNTYCDYYWTSENVCFFKNISFYNTASFICYIIAIALIILYPIIIVLIYRNDCEYDSTSENKDKNLLYDEYADFKDLGNNPTNQEFEMPSSIL